MFGNASRSRLAVAVLVVASVAASSITALAIAAGKSGDQGMSGGFVGGPPFGGPDCPSPIDICATATFTGTVHGPATVVITSLEPTSEPGVLVGVGDIVVQDPRGELRCTESIVVNFTPGGDSEEGWICRVTGGTGRFAGASGHIEGYGATDRHGDVSGRYGGKVTLP